jgi:hypothetical protein
VPARHFTAVSALLFLAACGPKYDNSLPDPSVLGQPRGLTILRTITHFHSPYSWDACDKNGLPNGVPDATCMADFREAACVNRLNYMFVTDHPNNMGDYEFDKLTLPGTGDQILTGADGPYGNLLNCPNGAKPVLLVGFESTLMALGMTKHLDPDPTTRKTLYNNTDLATANRLRTETGAIVAIPHTESKALSLITTVQANAIEIYNFHANIDPKIRENDLKLPPFEDIPGILTYLFDPYHHLNADFAFMTFLDVEPVYFTSWDTLLGSGMRVTGLGGTDSHENIFPQKVSDGERFDAHRRVARMFSNFVTTSQTDAQGVKNALSQGRSWVVFEGLGTPVGMDYYGIPFDNSGNAGTPVGSGEELDFENSATLKVKLPSLYSGSPSNGDKPKVTIVLKSIAADGTATVVAGATDSDLQYTTSTAGIFRAEVHITPNQLADVLTDFSANAANDYPWIIANPIYLVKVP